MRFAFCSAFQPQSGAVAKDSRGQALESPFRKEFKYRAFKHSLWSPVLSDNFQESRPSLQMQQGTSDLKI